MVSTHLKCLATALFVPAINLKITLSHLWPQNGVLAMIVAVLAQVLFLGFIVLQIVETGTQGMHTLGWLCFLFFCTIVSSTRTQMRYKHNVWGSPIDDMTATLFFWPLALSQMQMMADTDGKDAPAYWADADIVIDLMATNAETPGLPTTDVKAGVETGNA